MLALLLPVALATPSFDPTTPDAAFEGEETFTIDGSLQIWSRIERLQDPNSTLFAQETFNSVTAWGEDNAYAPWIGACFGTEEPKSDLFLLHMAPHEATGWGTPILFVPGAGDNASRGFVTMATHMDMTGRPVYALTFAHPHGDVFMQAEAVADAIARIKERTGAEQVDLVSHSKGGIAAAIYISNGASADWGRPAYLSQGTRYRGDVRKAVFIATPFGGIDTAFRWPLGNGASLTTDQATAPASWSTWYPYTTANLFVTTDLADQDMLPDGDDLFPGHRQIQARWDDFYELPGAQSWLGVYSLQPDWLTTYEGGLGFQSDSAGIDDVIAVGDHVLDDLAANGVDPEVRLYILAGDNPIMPNGTESWLTTLYGESWVDMATAGTDAWGQLVAKVVANSLEEFDVTQLEVQGLAQGKLVLGEITGPADGLVFVDSATDSSGLTSRGAVVVDSYVANLSHLDLLYASPITGELLKEDALTDPTEKGWEDPLGDRYIEADTIGWVDVALAEDVDPGDDGGGDGGGGEDTGGDGGGGDEGAGAELNTDPLGGSRGCGACSSAGAGGAGGWALLGLLGLLVRRRR